MSGSPGDRQQSGPVFLVDSSVSPAMGGRVFPAWHMPPRPPTSLLMHPMDLPQQATTCLTAAAWAFQQTADFQGPAGWEWRGGSVADPGKGSNLGCQRGLGHVAQRHRAYVTPGAVAPLLPGSAAPHPQDSAVLPGHQGPGRFLGTLCIPGDSACPPPLALAVADRTLMAKLRTKVEMAAQADQKKRPSRWWALHPRAPAQWGPISCHAQGTWGTPAGLQCGLPSCGLVKAVPQGPDLHVCP